MPKLAFAVVPGDLPTHGKHVKGLDPLHRDVAVHVQRFRPQVRDGGLNLDDASAFHLHRPFSLLPLLLKPPRQRLVVPAVEQFPHFHDGKPQVAQQHDPMQALHLLDGVRAVPREGIHLRRMQQTRLVVITKHADGNLCQPRKLADTEHGVSLLLQAFMIAQGVRFGK